MARPDVVEAARAWIGTPYRHQASCKGAGADCLGLVRGVWRELIGMEPETAPPYTADWAEAGGEEYMLFAADRHFRPGNRTHGDLLVFRMRDNGIAKHIGILATDRGRETLIHAYSGHGVLESPLAKAWARRIAGVYTFPDKE